MPKMDYKDLMKHLETKKFSKVYFLCGEEKYLIDNFEKKIKEKILGENFSDFDYKCFEFENMNLNLENLGESLEMPPIQSELKCITLRNLNAEEVTSEFSEDFIKILEDIPDFSVLIISQIPGKGAAKIKKIQNFIEKNGILVNFSSKDVPIQKQLISWAKNYDKILGKNEADLIIKRIGTNLSNLNSETKKICELEKREFITAETIEKITMEIQHAGIFELSKAVLAGNAKKSLDTLNILLSQKEEPIAILAILGSSYVDIARVKVATLSRNNSSILKNFFDYKGKDFKLKIAETNAKKWNLKQIQQKIKILIEADLTLKSSAIPPKLILSEVVCKLIS